MNNSIFEYTQHMHPIVPCLDRSPAMAHIIESR